MAPLDNITDEKGSEIWTAEVLRKCVLLLNDAPLRLQCSLSYDWDIIELKRAMWMS